MAVVRHCGDPSEDHKPHNYTGIDKVKCRCPGGPKPYKNITPGQGTEKKKLKPQPKYKFQQRRKPRKKPDGK